MQTDIDPRSLIGRKAFDRNGTKIGTVDEVYLDDATGVPGVGGRTHRACSAGTPSSRWSRASCVDDALRVPFDRALIKDAPDFGVGRHLSPEQELQLYHHYGLDVPAAGSGPTGPAGTATSAGPARRPRREAGRPEHGLRTARLAPAADARPPPAAAAPRAPGGIVDRNVRTRPGARVRAPRTAR